MFEVMDIIITLIIAHFIHVLKYHTVPHYMPTKILKILPMEIL
jgi:hypothetical protein